MNQSQAVKEIEALIGAGETEKAIDVLLDFFKDKQDLLELAQATRLQKADFLEIGSQVLRGTINSDDERVAYNKVRDNLLRIAQRIQAGKNTLDDPAPTGTAVWRYYVVGGVVALAAALLIWNLTRPKQPCPEYGNTKTQRVMILPFKRTGSVSGRSPEVDLSDAFNDLVAKDKQLSFKAESDVNLVYDIEKNYPNSSKAAAIGRDCGVELVVWGKTSDSKDTVEVRYRVVNGLATPKDSTTIPDYLNEINTLSLEGVFRGDVRSIAKKLYLVVATQEGSVDMALKVLNADASLAALDQSSAPAPMVKATGMNTTVDTTSLLLMAEAYLQKPSKKDSALVLFNEVLAHYPSNYRALRGRGLYFLKEKDYAAAVQDLHTAQPDPAKMDPVTLLLRTDAYLKGGWPEMARRDLEQIKQDSKVNPPKAWIQDREDKITDSIQVYKAKLKQATSAAIASPEKNTEAKLNIAKANIALGKPDEAVRYSESINRTQPKNTKALETTLEAYAQKGDLEKAQEALEKAERKGANTKDVKYRPPVIAPLSTEKTRTGAQPSGGGN